MASSRLVLAPILIALAFAPAAEAWSLDREPAPIVPEHGAAARVAGAIAAWTTDLSPRAFPPESVSQLTSAAACALGDVTGDGIADLAILVEAADGTLQLEARAGPGFEEVAWRITTKLERLLTCAPDLDLDGTLDPIIRTIGETTGTAAGAAADQATNAIQQTLDGASGAAMVGRVVQQSVTSAGAAGAGAAQQAAAALLPAAEGAIGFLQASTSGAALPLPVPLPIPGGVPLDKLTVVVDSAAKLQILDVTGSVVATVEVAQAGVMPLALAPVQLSGALPDIAVLSQATTGIQQVAGGVPELALYAADGALAWSTQLPASTGLPMLVPNAGDLDLDGVGDLIVTTVEQGVQAAPGAAYTVLSGVDGSILFTSGPAVSGLMAALPLGSIGSAPMLLEAAMSQAEGALQLSVLDGLGNVQWTATVDALAKPANAVLDAYTQDILGFTDLTGDGLPDVAVSVLASAAGASGALDLQVLDGLTGEVAWNASLPNVQHVMPVVIDTARLLADAGAQVTDAVGGAAGGNGTDGVNQSTQVATLAGLEGKVDMVKETAVGAASAVLAYGTTGSGAALALLDSASGQIVWTATASLPAGLVDAQLTAQVAGDLDGDRIQDLLVTAQAAVLSAASTPAGESADQQSGSASSGAVAAVSGATGETLWTENTDSASGQGLEFDSTAEPSGGGDEEGSSSSKAPSVSFFAASLALLAMAAWTRRR